MLQTVVKVLQLWFGVGRQSQEDIRLDLKMKYTCWSGMAPQKSPYWHPRYNIPTGTIKVREKDRAQQNRKARIKKTQWGVFIFHLWETMWDEW